MAFHLESLAVGSTSKATESTGLLNSDDIKRGNVGHVPSPVVTVNMTQQLKRRMVLRAQVYNYVSPLPPPLPVQLGTWLFLLIVRGMNQPCPEPEGPVEGRRAPGIKAEPPPPPHPTPVQLSGVNLWFPNIV